MLSVTDNSRGARGDVTALAAASPNSEANLDRYGESCRPVHLTQFIGAKLEADERVGRRFGTSAAPRPWAILDAADSRPAGLLDHALAIESSLNRALSASICAVSREVAYPCITSTACSLICHLQRVGS
jgi:hypothetical protein